MQKDLKQAAESIAESLNELHDNKKKSLLDLVKRQASELERRAKIISRLETSLVLQQKNIEKLSEQNKQLELMISSLREERLKLIEENEYIKNQKPTRTRTRTRKAKEKEGDVNKVA